MHAAAKLAHNILYRQKRRDFCIYTGFSESIRVTPTGTDRTTPTKESIQGIKDAVAHVRNGCCLGLIDWRVRLLRLPSEVFNKRGKVIRIALGEIIPPEQMQEFNDIDMLSNFLRNKVYNQH